MDVAAIALSLKADAEDWCRGRLWLPRAPVVALFAWSLLGYWRDYEYVSGVWPLSFEPLNLGIHELGHVLFSPLGRFLGVAGGSFLQCLAPVVAGAMFLRQRDYFAISVALFWLATNLFHVGTYCLDANGELNLPLVSPFRGEVVHDWYYLLDTTGLLHRNHAIAALLRAWASLAAIAGIALGAWICVVMARPSEPGARRFVE